MDPVSVIPLNNALQSYRADLCTTTAAASKKTSYFWVEVPKIHHDYDPDRFPSICYIDMWGEDTCSTLDDYPKMRTKETSCIQAYREDKELFSKIRQSIESDSYTKIEMRKVLRWVFNCTGRLPIQTCKQPIAQSVTLDGNR